MIISRTPFRVSFFGGGTDYPVWYEENGGAVLATSIDKYCYISCRYLPPFFEHKTRLVYSKIETVKGHEGIQHPAVRAILSDMEISDGLEIHHDGDLPARTGIGSSSSFTVGLLHCLFALKRTMPSKMQLAEEAIRVERELLRESVGSQDQASAAFGGFNRISFSRDGKINLQPVILSREKLEFFHGHLMLYFTGFSRFASEIADEQIRNTRNKKAELAEMAGMVDRALEILGGSEDLSAFGALLGESWMLKRSLSERIASPQIDNIYDTALKAGALGGKLLGAGGGGFMLLFAPPESQPKIREKLKDLLLVPFRLEAGGSQIIFYDSAAMDRDYHPQGPSDKVLRSWQSLSRP